MIKRFLTICAALLSLSLLAGCMPAVLVSASKEDGAVEKERSDLWEDAEDDSWSAWAEEWMTWIKGAEDRFSDEGKAHRWRVLDAGGQEFYTVSDGEQVKALDELLLCDDNSWDRLAKEPGDPGWRYVYSQEKTLLAGQDPDEEREYEDLMTFTVSAAEDVVTVRILGGLEELSLVPGVELEDMLTFFVSVPPETAEALRDPEQFGE